MRVSFKYPFIPVFTMLLMYANPDTVIAEVYKWVDENGRIHYGDKPGNTKSTKLDIKENHKVNDHDLMRELRRQRLLDVMDEERQEKIKQQELSSQQARENKINCDRAKNRLVSMEKSSYLMEKTSDPYNPRILSNAERVAATDEAQKAVNYWCSR